MLGVGRVPEVSVYVYEEGSHLEGEEGVGVDGQGEDADVGDAGLES